MSNEPKMSMMQQIVGLTDDGQRVLIALIQDGTQLGYIEYTPDIADAHVAQVTKYAGMARKLIASAKPKLDS